MIKIPTILMASILATSLSICADEKNLHEGKEAYFSHQYQKAIKLLSPLLVEGDSEAQYYLALMLLEKDASKAFNLLTLSAEQNHERAAQKLGDLYESGVAVKKNLLIAMDWYREAKKIGRITLKNITFISINTKNANHQDKISRLIEIAKKKDVDANMQLAAIYDDGVYIKHNEQESLFWLKKAAKLGNSNAMLRVGYFYCRGIGTKMNHDKANTWFLKSEREIKCH